jgi:PKD repeat protein
VTKQHAILSGLAVAALVLAGAAKAAWTPAAALLAESAQSVPSATVHTPDTLTPRLQAQPADLTRILVADNKGGDPCDYFSVPGNVRVVTDIASVEPDAAIAVDTGTTVRFALNFTNLPANIALRRVDWYLPTTAAQILNPVTGETDVAPIPGLINNQASATAPDLGGRPNNLQANGVEQTYSEVGVFPLAFRVRFSEDGGPEQTCLATATVPNFYFREGFVAVQEAGEPPNNASLNMDDLVVAGAGLLPSNDWVPLFSFNMFFAPDAPAPRALNHIEFRLRGEGLQWYDILEFGIFEDRGGENGAPDAVFSALTINSGQDLDDVPQLDPPLPILTFDAEGYPYNIDLNPNDLNYNLSFLFDPLSPGTSYNGIEVTGDIDVDTFPRDEWFVAGPDFQNRPGGNGWILAVRTSSAWETGNELRVEVEKAIMSPIFTEFVFDPVENEFVAVERIGALFEVEDSYTPNFLEGDDLNTGAYVSSFGVFDIRSPRPIDERYNQWNWSNVQYTPQAEFNRFRFNSTGFFLESVLGETLDLRDLISYESWEPLLGIDAHGQQSGNQPAQPVEVNIVLTDIGADPFGPPGNGGFDPRNGRLDNFTSNATFVNDSGAIAAGVDHTFNGINLFHDTNNDGAFNPPVPSSTTGGFGVQINDFPMYLSNTVTDFEYVVPGMLEWQYVPFPPGGGDPWWRAKMVYVGGGRPGDRNNENTNGIMEPAPDPFDEGQPRVDYFITMRADSGFRDVSGVSGDATALGFGSEMRAFIEPRRWNPEDGGHWDGGMRMSVQHLGKIREIIPTTNVYIESRLEFFQDDPRHDQICPEGVVPCPTTDDFDQASEVILPFPYWDERTSNRDTNKPVKVGVDVHDLVLTYSTNNAYAKVTPFRELQNFINFIGLQDPPIIFAPGLDIGNGLTQNFFGLLELRFWTWNSPFIIPDVLFAGDDLFEAAHYPFESTPFYLDADNLNADVRDPRSVYFPNPSQQPTLPRIENSPIVQNAVAFGLQSYAFLASEGDIANVSFIPPGSPEAEATYADDVYVYVAEDCSNCAQVQAGMWLVDRNGAKFRISAVSGNRFTLEKGHAAYLDRGFRFNNNDLSLPNYPFGVTVGENAAVRRGAWAVVRDTLARGQYMRLQDYPPGLSADGGTRAARLLRQHIEVNSGPTAMLGINLSGVNDPIVNLTETIGLNSITVAFWGPDFDPSDLAKLDPAGTLVSSGILLYEDSNQNGVFDAPLLSPFTGATLIAGDRIVPLEPGSLEWGITPEPINLDGRIGVEDPANPVKVFLGADLSGDGFRVFSEEQRESLRDEPGYDGLLDLAWVVRIQPNDRWTVPFTDPLSGFSPGQLGLKSAGNGGISLESSTTTELSPFISDPKALPSGGNIGDDLFVAVRTSGTIGAHEQFRAVVPSKLPSRTPASEQVAGLELSPTTYPVVQSFVKTDPEEGAVQSFTGHDMMAVSVPARVIDLTSSLVPPVGVQLPVIEPGSGAVAALGIDVSANQPDKLIASGTTGSQISSGYTTAGFTKTPTSPFFDGGWTDEAVGLYLIAPSEPGTSGNASRYDSFEITAANGNDLSLRAGAPRTGAPWFVVKDPTFLEHVVVEFDDVELDGNFDPQKDLLPLNFEDPAASQFSGVSLYRDNDFHPDNRNGVFDPPILDDETGEFISYVDLPLTLDATPVFIGIPGEPQYQVKFVFSTPGTDDLRGRTNVAYEAQPRNRQWIPQTFGLGSSDPDTGSDFFVVLRTSREMSAGDDFRVGIVSWGPDTPSLPDPDNFSPSLAPSQLPGQNSDEFDIFDEFPWGNRGLGFITMFQRAEPYYYWGWDHAENLVAARQEVDTSQDDKDVRFWRRSHPVVSGATNPIISLSAPVIDFTADRNRQVVGEPVAFTLLTDSSVASVLWNFGDGNTSTERDPEHSYAARGVYTVSVTVRNTEGVSETLSKRDYIEITDAPFADFVANPTDGNITPDPDGLLQPGLDVAFVDRSRGTSTLIPTQYFWDFGDGTQLTTTTRATGEAPLIHRYTQEGFYTVTLEVTFLNPVTQVSEVATCRIDNYITVRPCIGCPGGGGNEGEGDGEGEGGEDPPAADFEVTTLIRDKEALVPLHDWMPLVNFTMGFDEEDVAPRILRTLTFRLRPDTRDPDAWGLANLGAPEVSDILEFGIFQETYNGENESENNLLNFEDDFLLYTFSNTGAPIGTVTETGNSLLYFLNFIGRGTAANPDFLIEAGPDTDTSISGNSYILAVRTSATWRSQLTLGIDVLDAQMINPSNGSFPVDEEGAPIDSYSPDFLEEDLSDDQAYSSAFTVFDTTGEQFSNVQVGGSAAAIGAPYNFWNHPGYLYTPLSEYTRPKWSSIDQLLDLNSGEYLELRQLVALEQWVPVIAMNLHSGYSEHFDFFDPELGSRGFFVEDRVQLREVNLVLTDVGGDPFGPAGNGGFDPRDGLDSMTDRNWDIYEPAFADDATYNGIWVWSDTNGDGGFDPPVPNEVTNGVNFPGDRPLFPDFTAAVGPWEYIPFPPGGGDPWWRITLRFFGGERRPDSEQDDNFLGYVDAVPDNFTELGFNSASEVKFDYFVTVRADSGFQDVSLKPGDGGGISAGADFRAFVEPRRFDATTGSLTGGIYVDSMIPPLGLATNGVTVFSRWQDDARWGTEEPWWPERTLSPLAAKPVRVGVDVHDLAMTYQSDSSYRIETDIFFGFGPFSDSICLGYANYFGDPTDFMAWTDPFGLAQGKFLNQHGPGVTRWRFFGGQTFEFGAPVGTIAFTFDETNSSGQFAYETVPFFSNRVDNGDVPPRGPRSQAYPNPPVQPTLPDYSTWPATQRPEEYQRASDWADEDNQARLLTQKIDIQSPHTAILGINTVGTDDPVVNQNQNQTIGRISVAFWGPGFNPSDLATLDARGENRDSGVLLWEDTDANGVFANTSIFDSYADGLTSLITFDRIVPLQDLRWRSTPELIDLDGDGVPDDMNGDGVVDDLDKSWVLDMTPRTLWPLPRNDTPTGGFGTIFELITCGSFDFSKDGTVQTPFRAEFSRGNGVAGGQDKDLDPLLPAGGDDLFVTIRTSDQGTRFEPIRAVIPATLPERPENQRRAGVQFFPQFNTSPGAFVKTSPDEDPVQDFYGHDTLELNVPVKITDFTNQNQNITIGGAAIPVFGIDLSTNQGRSTGTLASGSTGTAANGVFTVNGAAWAANAFAGDVLIDSNFESFEITSNTADTLNLFAGAPAEGSWRIVRSPTFFEQVVVELYNEGTDSEFNPFSDLLPLALDQAVSGVAVYRDNDNHPNNKNGIFDAGIDIPLPLDAAPAFVGQAGEDLQVKFVFSSPGTDDIPVPRADQQRNRQWIFDTFGASTSDPEFGPDFFVIIRASDRMAVDDNLRMGIVSWGPNTPTEPDPDTWARLSSEARNDFTKFREFPWATRGLGFISYSKEPLVRYFFDGDRAGQKADNSGFDWVRSHTSVKRRSGVITAAAQPVDPNRVVITGANETTLPSSTLPGKPFNIVVFGENFGSAPDVVISGYEVTVLASSGDKIDLSLATGDVPPVEPIVIIVRNTATNREASRSDLFNLGSVVGNEPPDVVSATPGSGGENSFPVTIRGTNLPSAENARVLFNGTQMPILSASPDGTSITVGFPAGGLPSTGGQDITVQDLSTGRQDILINGFNYENDPQRGKSSFFGCSPQAGGSGGPGDLAVIALMAVALLAGARRSSVRLRSDRLHRAD